MTNEKLEVTIPYELRDDFIESDHIKEDIKDVKLLISNLKANSGNSTRRKISVRRKFCWQDYCEYLSKSWMKNIIQYEVAFVGEPAVDIGRPKRDFFSGKRAFVSYHLY